MNANTFTNTGNLVIAFLCCVWPLICSAISIWAYRRFQRRGIGSFIPKIRTEGFHK